MKYIISLLVAIFLWSFMSCLQNMGAHELNLSSSFKLISDILFAIVAIFAGLGAGCLYHECTKLTNK